MYDCMQFYLFDAVPEPNRKDASQDVQVKEEREPGSRLMFGHTRDDGDVDLGVARVPQRVEPGFIIKHRH